MKKVIIEKFTRTRYERYEKKGIQMRIFSDWRSKEWKLKQFDCGRENKQVLFSHTEYNEYQKKDVTDTFFFDEKGKDWNIQLYIVQGFEGIEEGDIIISKHAPDASFFFYKLFDGFCTLEKAFGFRTHWQCDCLGGQISLAHTFSDCTGCLKHDYYIRKATEEEVAQFYKHLLAGGYAFDEEEGYLYDVPKVGTEYYSIEPDTDGLMHIVHHEAPMTEDDRTFGKRNIFTYKERAQERADKMNQLLMHGKLR